MAVEVVRFVVLAVLGMAIFLALAATSADVDLWGHVRFGLDMIREGSLETSDPYSFTSDRPWINHEWLSEIVFATAWRVARTPGLIAVKLLASVGALWFALQTMKLRGVGGEARLVLLGLTLAGMLPRLVHVRPQLFSVLLFSILMWVFARVESGRRSTLALCPILLVLWTNFHGGWITGLGALGLWALGDAWVRRHEGARALDGLLWTAAAAAATLLNPYGVGLWTFLGATVRFGREGIGEWWPIWTQPTSLAVWLLFVLMILAAIRSTGVSALGTRLVQPVFWGLASLKVVRLDAFFVLSVAGFLGPAIERFLGRREHPRAKLSISSRAAIAGGVLVLALMVPATRRTLTCIAMYEQLWPEPAATQFIREKGLSGRMLTFFRWGEYALWHLSPSIRVSMDGRRETVYSDETFSKHLQFYAGAAEGVSYVERLEPDYAWLPVNLPAADSLKKLGWTPLFEGTQSVLVAAPGRHVAGLVQPRAVPRAVPRCFPGP